LIKQTQASKNNNNDTTKVEEDIQKGSNNKGFKEKLEELKNE